VTGTILGFAEERPFQAYGARVFLDVGVEGGVTVGDIFRAYVEEPGPYFGTKAAELQVVLVEENRVTARIIGITHPGLDRGRLLRLVAKIL
jgi:hypothetical protein